MMSNAEYDLLDELYFQISFNDLMEKTDMNADDLSHNLFKIYQKNWLRCFLPDGNELINIQEKEFLQVAAQCNFFASKKGLIAHNSVG